MTGKERVIKTIKRERPDRMPIYAWVNNEEFSQKVIKKYGSIDKFDEKYDFDINHLFPPAGTFKNFDYNYMTGNFFDDELPDIEFTDPNSMPYAEVKKRVDYLSGEMGRFVYAQTPGCFEHFNGVYGIENHLNYLLIHTDQLYEFYQKLADWTVVYANNLIDIGVDMIHISDDWGGQTGTLFSLELFDKLVYPYHKKVIEAVKKRGAYVSLHSDGNVQGFLGRICELGFDVVHPYQESAGMSYAQYWQNYKDNFVIMGGIDVQSTIGFGNYENLEKEIRRVVNMFKNGNMILCTTHMIQPHGTVEEAEFAYDLVHSIIDVK